MDKRSDARWRLDGVRVVRSSELDINTAQTPGMNRAAAITHARAGRRNYGPEPSSSTRRPRPGRTIMGRWRA